MVPDGVEEVVIAKINLEQREWDQKLLIDDIRKLSDDCETSGDLHREKEGELWMVNGGKTDLVRILTHNIH